MEKKPGIALKIFGGLVVVSALIGTWLKLNHWPGANICVPLVAFTLLFFYLPLWFAEARKDKREKWFVIIQYAFTSLFVLAQTFKMMHWPYGNIMINLLFWGTLCIVIPATIWKLVRFSRNSLYKFNNLVLMVYLLTFLQVTISRMAENNVGASSIILGSHQAERAYKTVSAKSFHLYHAFDEVSDKDHNPYYQKAVQLKKYTDSLENYLQEFKKNIVRLVEDSGWINVDSFSIADIRKRTETHIPTSIIVGDDPARPRTGHFSGLELKGLINRYRDSIVTFVDEGSRPFIASGINLNTSNVYNEDYEAEQDWVSATFFNYPTITVLITLTNLQYEVRNAETQVLTNLLNSALNSSKDNIAGKIADLAAKLETEKQSREIENLQKEKELAGLKLQSKNQEIADRDQTIVLFSFILIAVGVLVFYVIRSNIIRKRINKQLEEQKRTIEEQKQLVDEAFEKLHEKNKEVLDSIHYARRIQQALISSEHYISKHLGRLQKK